MGTPNDMIFHDLNFDDKG
jgi:ankyrin repeat protein